jgi:hypothetical protein
MSEIVYAAAHFSPVLAFALALTAALGWPVGTALWRWVGGIGRRG